MKCPICKTHFKNIDLKIIKISHSHRGGIPIFLLLHIIIIFRNLAPENLIMNVKHLYYHDK